jgi:hypothetical protein
MPRVLTSNSIIMCPHGGVGISAPIDLPPKWMVQGGAVLLENDGGIFPPPPLPGCVGIPHCGGYKLVSMGLNASYVNGRKVILATDFNQTFTGLPLLITATHKAIDDSTPVPIPPGQTAPSLPPELVDLAAPAVTALPTALLFTKPNSPASHSITFTLLTAHPLKWMLTMIDKQAPAHKDMTAGGSGFSLSPSGGGWTTPSLSVKATMTTAFMAGLPNGKYEFYMIGVSRRGLSAFDVATLTVS